MPGNAGTPLGDGIDPDAVLAALPQTQAAVVGEMPFESAKGDHACVTPPLEWFRTNILVVTSTLSWTAVFDTVENGWVHGRVAELPGVITAAPTLAEAKTNLVDALHEYLASLAEPATASENLTTSRREALDVVIQS